MSKKIIAFISILSLSISIPLIPANAAAKAGAKCNKAGFTSIAAGKTFTCIKSGRKLVWDNGITVMKSTTGTSSPKFVPPTLPTSFQD